VKLLLVLLKQAMQVQQAHGRDAPRAYRITSSYCGVYLLWNTLSPAMQGR
jgi:hypothetical protein